MGLIPPWRPSGPADRVGDRGRAELEALERIEGGRRELPHDLGEADHVHPEVKLQIRVQGFVSA